MNCKICGKEMRSAIGFNYGRNAHGKLVATDSYEIVTCDNKACPAEGVTADTRSYDQTVDAFLANPPQPRVLIDAPAMSDATLVWGK